jgi:acetoin utilization deacetylase AcuC-like enzyme
MSTIHPVYHDDYDLDLGAHVFPSRKYRLIHDRLLADGLVDPADFRTPEPIAEEDLLRVHTRDWIQRLRDDRLSGFDIMRLEIPVSPAGVRAVWLAAGGSLLAARLALEDGIGFNIGGGLHHAYPGHGEGFCAVHDVAVAIRRLQADGVIKTALVVDTDVHHGNGTAAIFKDDDSVFTFSIHQYNNYPAHKPPSDLDVHLPDGIGDAEYLERLNAALDQAFSRTRPDLVAYLAGADPYREDQLGGLSLTMEGLERRDRLVLDRAVRSGIPAFVTLAGGYAMRVEDTVTIHVTTLLAARKALAEAKP